MDPEASRRDWRRLDQLGRRRRLTGVEADELLDRYHAAGAELTRIRSTGADPASAAQLSGVLARARTVLTGTRTPTGRALARFVTVGFPVTVYRAGRWIIAAAAFFVLVAVVVAVWITHDPQAMASLGSRSQLRQLAYVDFQSYYSTDTAAAFAASVWTNNALIAGQSLVLGVFLIPVPYVVFTNALNVGVAAAVMSSFGRLDVFFGLITPHGLLELTAVFVAAGAGLRLGWSWVDPGPLTRGESLARTGRATVRAALGLTVVLAVSGLIESVVTPSGLATWVRIGIGVLAEAAFLTYVVVFGRRAVAAGQDGDLAAEDREAVRPTAG